MGLREVKGQLLGAARTSQGRAVLVYLVVAPTSNVVSTVVGSLSEYRFPHPLLTTELHLAISLVALVTLSMFASAVLSILLLQPPKRLLSTPKTPPSSTTSSSPFLQLLASLASHAPSRRSPILPLSSHSLAAALLATLTSLLEMHAARITEAPFWQLARLLPLPLVVSLAEGGSKVSAMILWGVLMAGPSVGVGAGTEGCMVGAVWAVSVAGWVMSARKGFEVGEKEDEKDRSSPTVVLQLSLTFLLLLPPLLLSGDIGAARSSGHLSFFTEVGFWLQESVMALAGLASLGAFWGLLRHLSAPSVLAVVGLKDFLLPQLFHLLFGNPLPDYRVTGSRLSIAQQWLALVLLGAWKLRARAAPSRQAETVKRR